MANEAAKIADNAAEAVDAAADAAQATAEAVDNAARAAREASPRVDTSEFGELRAQLGQFSEALSRAQAEITKLRAVIGVAERILRKIGWGKTWDKLVAELETQKGGEQ